ncbi:MAG: putative bifunctional diguanylate cyclase/phosphodiesterase [Vicinamibacterales bacterium]
MEHTQALPAGRLSDELSGFRLSFVAEVFALIAGGPLAMTAAALASIVIRWTVGLMGPVAAVPLLLRACTLAAGTQISGQVYSLLAPDAIRAGWPWTALPIGLAILAYCAVTLAAAEALESLAARRSSFRFGVARALHVCAWHVAAGAIGTSLAVIVDHRAWSFAPIAGILTLAVWWASRSTGVPSARVLGALDSPDAGLVSTDADGCIVMCTEKAGELLDCVASAAVGMRLADVVGGLPDGIPRAIAEVVRTRTIRVFPRVIVRESRSTRTLDLTILPDGEGAALVWRDASEHVGVQRDLAEITERFDLVSAGANDGLWFLNQGTRHLHVSARWKAMIGLPGGEATIPLSEWFDRVHPDDAAGLKSAIAAHLEGKAASIEHEHRVRHEDGGYRRMLCRGIAGELSKGGAIGIGGSLSDVTESAMAREHLLDAGMRDPLTGLSNRTAFVEELGQRLSDLQQRRGARFAVLYLDLDRFKVVNDSLGHLVGDELLVAVSRRIESCLRPADTIARLGGDEFALLLRGLADGMQANVVAFRIQDALRVPFTIGGREVVTSVSIGIAFSRNEYTNPEEIMRDADTAMYHAKAHGKARHVFFDADMHARALDRLSVETDLRHAVQSSGFEVHYQPIVRLSTRMCVGFEALVRWKRLGRPVSPGDFIPMAEELGLIEPLGSWVLAQSCRQLSEWRSRHPDSGIEYVSVNVSTRQLTQQGFAYLVERTVGEAGIQPSDLRLEITETALMDAPQAAANVLAELRDFGVKIYLDDFGTGYSSLSHLHKLPVDALKIDRSFVTGILLDDRPAIVESILALARTLDTSVIAEGVEHETQACELERLGCAHAQGFYFSRPLLPAGAEELIAAARPLGSYPYVARAAAVS